jgi:hypothetical protein
LFEDSMSGSAASVLAAISMAGVWMKLSLGTSQASSPATSRRKSSSPAPRAGFFEIGFARARIAFESRVIQPFDLFPSVTLHITHVRNAAKSGNVIETFFCPGYIVNAFH